MTEKMMVLFKMHLKNKHDLVLYPYQLDIARALFDALIQNLRLTAGASEEDVKKLRVIEIPVEISRQAGKTTAIVHAVEFILLFFTEQFKRPIRIGIFAPQREQSKTDFDRLKFALARSTNIQVKIGEADEESNSKTIVLPNQSSCYVFPVTSSSKPESKTLDLIIFEESQDVDDKIMKEQIWPMGAATNAARVYIGTAGTRICYFYRLGQEGGLKLYFEDIVKQRRQVYEETGNALHLIYEQSVRGEIEKHGIDSDEIARPFFGRWLIGTGQFVTQEALDALETDRKRTFHDKQSMCFAGIDIAKHPDSTVVTILRYNQDTGKKEVLNWMELRGEDYLNQFEIMHEFLKKYNVIGLALDSTGIGDFMSDTFKAQSEWSDEHSGFYPIKFSNVSKDNMYKNLKVSIQELLTTLPDLSTREGSRFKQQMLDLQQEYKGQLLSVSHPDDPNAHDDYPDSWALAEWAYALYNASNAVGVAIISTAEERKVAHNDRGEVEDYWPGLDGF